MSQLTICWIHQWHQSWRRKFTHPHDLIQHPIFHALAHESKLFVSFLWERKSDALTSGCQSEWIRKNFVPRTTEPCVIKIFLHDRITAGEFSVSFTRWLQIRFQFRVDRKKHCKQEHFRLHRRFDLHWKQGRLFTNRTVASVGDNENIFILSFCVKIYFWYKKFGALSVANYCNLGEASPCIWLMRKN